MDKFCKFCGVEHVSEVYPKICDGCNKTTFRNPIPVAVLLQPVDTPNGMGLLIGRRAIAPFIGEWALIGGYVDDEDDSIEAAAVREMREETCIDVSTSGDITLLESYNTRHGSVLVFCGNENPIQVSDLNVFVPNHECSEIRVALEPEPLCFQSHTDALVAWFDGLKKGYAENDK